MYSHCNICNIQIKHMQHTSETHETYDCNTCSSTCYRPVKVDAGAGEAQGEARDAGSMLREVWMV
jgi:hypothetical protein